MRRKRLITCVGVTTALVGVALPAWAFIDSSSPSVSPTVHAQQLADATNPAATGASATSVTISWGIPSPQATGAVYQVVRTAPTPVTTVCTQASSPCTDSNLTTGTTYSYAIQTLHEVNSTLDNWQRPAISAGSAKPTVVCGLSLATSPTAGTIETAGTAFSVVVTAQTPNAAGTACVTDTSYTGNHAITWSGGNTAPDGTHTPALPTAGNVNFTSGAATVDGFTLYAAGSNTITATSGDTPSRTGSLAVSVNALLSFTNVKLGANSVSCGSITGAHGNSVSFQVNVQDAYGNVVYTSGNVNLSFGSGGGTLSSSTATVVTPNTTSTTITDSFGNGYQGGNITASAPGYAQAICAVGR